MSQHKGTPLLEAVLAGVPLALLVALVLYIADLPVPLMARGMALAFGVGAAFELLSARAGWAKALGLLTTLLVLAGFAAAWSDWSRFMADPVDVPASRADGSGAVEIVVPANDPRSGARRGWGPIRWSPRPTDEPARGALSPTLRQPSGAEGEPGGGGGAPITVTDAGSPASSARGSDAPDPSRGIPTALTVRNDTDMEVEVTVTGRGVTHQRMMLEAGAETEIRIEARDPSRARIAWRQDDEERSISWPEAAHHAVFTIRTD